MEETPCHRSKVSLLSDAQGVELPLQPLPTCRPLPPQALGMVPAEAGTHVPAARCQEKPLPRLAFLCLLLGTRKVPDQGWPLHACHLVLRKATARADPLMMAGRHQENLPLGPDLSCLWPLTPPAHLLPMGFTQPRQLCHLCTLSSPRQT